MRTQVVSTSTAISRVPAKLASAGLVILGLLASPQDLEAVMGFTRQFDFLNAPGSNFHLISLPWNYTPIDVGTLGVLDAEDLCVDLGGSTTVAAVTRWIEATSTVVEHLCGAASPFPLAVGIGYGVRNASGRDIRGAVAGVHNDSFSYSLAATGGSQLSWLSIPYHLRIPEKLGSLVVTAEDVCRQAGVSEVFAVVRWNNSIAAYESYGCGSEFQGPFEIERGQAYGLVNRGTQTIAWQPIHY